MFYVRSARALAPHSPIGSSLHVIYAAAPTPFCLLALHVALSACLPLDSAEHGGVQPAAEFRHVQSHEHGVHVSGALRACPCHRTPVGSSLYVTWAAALTPSSLLALHVALSACLPLDSAGHASVQPAAESQHVQCHKNAVHVLCALRACPCPNAPVGSSLHITWAATPTPSRLLALHVALMVCLPLDSAVGDGIQPAAESRHVQSHKNELRVLRALRSCPCPQLTCRVLRARYLGCHPNALLSPGPPCRPHGMPPF